MNWYILQLQAVAEKRPLKQVIENIQKILGKNCEFFPGPYKVSIKTLCQKFSIISGYLFVRTENEIMEKHSKSLEGSEFVEKVITEFSQFSIVSDEVIAQYMRDLNTSFEGDFKPNQIVKIISGPYKNLLGRVILVDSTNNFCMVKIELHSITMIVKVLFMCLEQNLEIDRTDNLFI